MSSNLVKDIMTKDVIAVRKNFTIGQLSKILLKNKISGVPVVDEEGRLIGMVTDVDIITEDMKPVFPIYFDPLIISYAFIENFEKYKKDITEYLETPVEEIMKRRVKYVRENTPVSEAARIMVREKINRIPVVDENNKVIGIVARADIIKSIVREAEKGKK